jgi:Tfp pilus assembly protein PilZ
MLDKRESTRKIKHLHITFFCGEGEHKGISSNFSYTGLFIKTRKKCKPGSSVNMILEIDDNQKIVFRGVVAWAKITSLFHDVKKVKKTSIFNRFNDGIGIKLTEPPQAYKDFLEALIKEHS